MDVALISGWVERNRYYTGVIKLGQSYFYEGGVLIIIGLQVWKNMSILN